MSKSLRSTAVILAAGKGTRMRSARPKVMHTVCERPMVHWAVDAALGAQCTDVLLVVGHGGELVEASLAARYDARVRTTWQHEQKGTGHAAQVAMLAIPDDVDEVVLYYGDCPLLRAEDVAAVRLARGSHAMSMAVCELENPHGYGRVLRDARGGIARICEQKDLANEAERAVREVNPGVYAFEASFLRRALQGLQPNNAQGEYYLTDLVEAAARSGDPCVSVLIDAQYTDGINDRAQLAVAEARMNQTLIHGLRLSGVTVHEGARIGANVVVEEDAIIESGVVLRGSTRVGRGALIDVGSVLTDAIVHEGARIGPFAHLRPGADIGPDAHVGNFVEVKKTRLGARSKANHLAYLGDGDVGADVNVGAGVIFCNYDGFNKQLTTIRDGAFIGSDSQLVAPVTVGKGAYVGTGTTVTRDVPEGALAIGRMKQENKEGYAERLRARMKATKEGAR